MRQFYYIVIVGILLSMSSCVPTKSLTYLQESDFPTDSLISVQRVQKPYRLQTNDVLTIRVKATDQELVGRIINPVGNENPNAATEERLYYDGYRVDEHGNIRMPQVGDVNVLGYTVEEIRLKLREILLNRIFKLEAEIFVTVKLAGVRYTINGEVARPGSKTEFRDQITILDAIANAGDISTVGDRQNVTIIRQYPDGYKVHRIDVTSIEAINSPYYYVQPNDLILINPLPQKSYGTGTTGLQTFTTLASILSVTISTVLLLTRL